MGIKLRSQHRKEEDSKPKPASAPLVIPRPETWEVKDRNVSLEELKAVIMESEGFVSKVGRMLNISVFKVKKLLEKYPEAAKMMEEFNDLNLDFAEEKLMTKIALGDTVALLFYLKCKGKGRGYVERTDVQPQRRPVKIKVMPAEKNADKDGRMQRLNAERSRGKKIADEAGDPGNIINLFRAKSGDSE